MRAISSIILVTALAFGGCGDDQQTGGNGGNGGSSSPSSGGSAEGGDATAGGGDVGGAASGGNGVGGNGGDAAGGSVGDGGSGGGAGGDGSGGDGSGGMGDGGAGGQGPGILSNASYDPVMVFPNHSVIYTPTGIAWDGTSFWVTGDGNLGGFTEVQYDGAGEYIASYEPGVGFSSVYTKGDGVGPVFGRELTWNVVSMQYAPGQWSAPATLAGGNPPTMMAIVWDADHSEYIGQADGTLQRWNSAGQALPSISLQGYGTVSSEAVYPASRRVAWAYGHYLTYSETVLSAWDTNGVRVATAVLNGAGTTDFDSHLSFSFAQGKVWVLDDSQGDWRGYDIAP
ncbi:MAG: hypothetical protein HOW73_19300 [Polyangiaceae bacterium]|nr:hypothetical protein [Polyangiaceae bacterium]